MTNAKSIRVTAAAILVCGSMALSAAPVDGAAVTQDDESRQKQMTGALMDSLESESTLQADDSLQLAAAQLGELPHEVVLAQEMAAPVAEPGTWALLGLGIISLGLARRRLANERGPE